MSNPVLLEQHGRLVLMTLNRPEKLNALNYATIDLLQEYLVRLEQDPNVRVIVLTGVGDKAFSAGADIAEFSTSMAAGVPVAVREFVGRGQAMTSRLETFPKPIIAAVGGIAFGGGCEITEAAHLAVASERAVFAKPEIRIGIPPTFGGTQRLPRLAGRKRALEHLLTGEAFSAERALELGIINKVVPHGHLLDEAFALADKIAAFAPETVAGILKAVTDGLNVPVAEGLRIERDQFVRVAGNAATKDQLDAWIHRKSKSA
jgi:enoyl-CoA hydratase/carnithine racemase